MLLAIDIGNSQIGLGLGDAEGWRSRWRLPSDARRTRDEFMVLVRVLLEMDGLSAEAVERVVLCSVVPALTPVIDGMCQRLFGCRALVVEAGLRTGMAVDYDPPASLGSDRLVDALAARERFGAPVIVVDFGTATTFNVVDAKGRFAGGAIAPGVGVAATALAAAGARLSRIDLSPPADDQPLPLVGRSTEQSMRSGILFGYAGLVGGMLTRMERELDGGESPTVVATGGMAGAVAPLVPRIQHHLPDLILDGLRRIDAMHRGEAGGRPAPWAAREGARA